MTSIPRDDTRRRILDAAADAFMRRSYAEITVDDLAHRIGATKGLIYYHFRSKFDVFLAVYRSGMDQVFADVQPAAERGDSARERLHAMSVEHLVNLMTYLGYHHVVHRGVRDQASTALTEAQREALAGLNELRQAYETLFRNVVEDGITDGSLDVDDPQLATRVLLGGLNAVDAWFQKREDQPHVALVALAEQIVHVLLNGLTARSS